MYQFVWALMYYIIVLHNCTRWHIALYKDLQIKCRHWQLKNIYLTITISTKHIIYRTISIWWNFFSVGISREFIIANKKKTYFVKCIMMSLYCISVTCNYSDKEYVVFYITITTRNVFLFDIWKGSLFVSIHIIEIPLSSFDRRKAF